MNKQEHAEKMLLRVSEAAEMLSIARSRAYAMVLDGTLPAVRLGGRSIRIPLDQLRAYVESLSKSA
jgi:excisionase family DNA binding protein